MQFALQLIHSLIDEDKYLFLKKYKSYRIKSKAI